MESEEYMNRKQHEAETETEVSIFIIIIAVALDGIGGRKRTLFFLTVPRPLPRVPTPAFFGLLEVLLMPSLLVL